MRDEDYRELITALWLHPEWAREFLDAVRRRPQHSPLAGPVAELRASGHTFRQIGDQLGFSSLRASQIHQRLLEWIKRADGIAHDGELGSPGVDLSEVPVAALGLDRMHTRALMRARIRSVADLLEQDEQQILRVLCIGRVGLRRIRDALARHGLVLRGQQPTRTAFGTLVEDLRRRFRPNGEFVLGHGDRFRDVMRARGVPNEPGVCIVSGQREHATEVLYVGKAGTISQEGTPKPQGLSGRLANLQGRQRRQVVFQRWLQDGPWDTLRFEWIVTWSAEGRLLPAKAEADLLQAYLSDHGCLPKENLAV